ncbi:MAG: hypothetical protein HYR72_04005 [Deltaproteobacteria bacterium]|nr:hypothetical protein [Deltaproteobacteria bacterium]MBI3388649.1 hypothetical protein [Deltaproteobacteria bacterium]
MAIFLAACGGDNEGGTATPANTPSSTGAVCGNGVMEGSEECDDGNTIGGDGCAANCTVENRRLCVFGPDTVSKVQTAIFAIQLRLTGQQTLTTGHPRTDSTFYAGSSTPAFAAMEVPIVIAAPDMTFDPVKVSGVGCACVRSVPVAAFGGMNSAEGKAGCGSAGLANVNYLYSIDHDTHCDTPDPDPNCTSGTPEDGSDMHPHNPSLCSSKPACNAMPVTTFSGSGPTGSAVINSNTSVSLLPDGGTCKTVPPNTAGAPEGPDGIPCTADDVGIGKPNLLATTTGTATAQILNTSDIQGTSIADGQVCGASHCRTKVTGSALDCGKIMAGNPMDGLSGSSQVSAFGNLDEQTGDVVVTGTFACQ